MSDDIVRAPDNRYYDQLISNEYNYTGDFLIDQAIQNSLKTADEECKKKIREEKFNSQISRLQQLNEERELELRKEFEMKRQQNIEERAEKLKDLLAFLNRTKMKDLLSLVNIYIQTGDKINCENYDIFINEINPKYHSLLDEIICIPLQYDSDDENYIYDSDMEMDIDDLDVDIMKTTHHTNSAEEKLISSIGEKKINSTEGDNKLIQVSPNNNIFKNCWEIFNNPKKKTIDNPKKKIIDKDMVHIELNELTDEQNNRHKILEPVIVQLNRIKCYEPLYYIKKYIIEETKINKCDIELYMNEINPKFHQMIIDICK